MKRVSALTMPTAAQLAPLMGAYDAAVAAKRLRLLVGIGILLAAIAVAGYEAEIRPTTFWNRLGNFTSYFDRLLTFDITATHPGQRVWTDPAEWFWGLRRWSIKLGETLMIAYVGTALGVFGATIGAVCASRSLMPSAVVRFAVKRLLEFGRTVPDIVFALLFVVAFGLGPMPGVLAIAVHTAGTLGKLFAEVIENIDMNPVEGVAASGASWWSQIRFGVLPQVLSNFASYALLRFEINVRGATVIGFVGAGGIGTELLTAIRKFYYSDVSAILLMLIVCVMLIDFGSERLRHRLLALEGGR